MLDPDGLNVWSDQRLVGYLWRKTQGLIGFRYEEQWLAQSDFAISHALPLQAEEFAPEEGLAHRFFANLLPEGGVRDQIVRDLKLANTDFDLLRAIGSNNSEYPWLTISRINSSSPTSIPDCFNDLISTPNVTAL